MKAPSLSRRLLTLALGTALAACGTTPRGAPTGTDRFPSAAVPAPDAGLRLRGELRGPVRGLGRSIGIDAWVRGDGWLRADLRYEATDGGVAHEVLVWGPDVALLLDRRRGRLTELGSQPGRFDVLGAEFRLEEALWVALGLPPRVGPQAPVVEWSRQEEEWRGRVADKGLRRPVESPPGWWELVWRDGTGTVHALQSRAEERERTAWGSLPRRLSLEGDDLEGRLVASWQITEFAALGDSVFDPLWEPDGR